MYLINCVFDISRNLPLYAVVFDTDEKELDFYPLYMKSPKTSLCIAEDNFNYIKAIIVDHKVILSGFKNYVNTFKLDPTAIYNVYDVPMLPIKLLEDEKVVKKLLIKGLKQIKCKPEVWQKTLAKAQIVYAHLEQMGYWNNKECHPKYEFTYTGRSISTVDNIQGANQNDDVLPIDVNHDRFVCFDWVSADFRTISILSGDESMNESFIKSDPYTKLFEQLKHEDISRSDCKLELLKSFYSIDHKNPIFGIYPKVAEWMRNKESEINENGFSSSILGRKFKTTDERPLKSTFNAQVQGSLAHAMQNVLYKIYKILPNNMVADIHDSLVMSCNSKHVDKIKEIVSSIMLKPFDGILDDNPSYPLKISVGTKWKQWKEIEEVRGV